MPADSSRRLRGIIFDLDGTLVDSHLDFDAMRREMELPDGSPVLESVMSLEDNARAKRCWEVLERHEQAGARRATLVPGVREFLAQLAERGLQKGIATRNSRRFALETLSRLDLDFNPVMTRDDAPIKPNPEAIWAICRAWDVAPEQTVIIGDYRFDLEAGRAAGTRAVLYTRLGAISDRPWAASADYRLHSFQAAEGLWDWLDQPI